MPYVGVLYAGIMLTPDGPKVLEFNCRFGDPETQVLLPLLESDLLEVFLACVEARLEDVELSWRNGAAVTVVMVAQGYPETYASGVEITGIAAASALGCTVYLAGATAQGGAAAHCRRAGAGGHGGWAHGGDGGPQGLRRRRPDQVQRGPISARYWPLNPAASAQTEAQAASAFQAVRCGLGAGQSRVVRWVPLDQ